MQYEYLFRYVQVNNIYIRIILYKFSTVFQIMVKIQVFRFINTLKIFLC